MLVWGTSQRYKKYLNSLISGVARHPRDRHNIKMTTFLVIEKSFDKVVTN